MTIEMLLAVSMTEVKLLTKVLLEQSFIADMLLLAATSAFGLGRRCYVNYTIYIP